MKIPADAPVESAIWARADAFPAAPGDGWGWVDPKGRKHLCDSRDALLEIVRRDQDARVILVWTPECQNLILPEELAGAELPVIESRRKMAAADLAEAVDRLRWFGLIGLGLCAWLLFHAWRLSPPQLEFGERTLLVTRMLLQSTSLGIIALMTLIFGLIPWYQALKRSREYRHWTAADITKVLPVLRFETWLDLQKAPCTRFLLVCISVVGAAQVIFKNSLIAAGMIKPLYLAGEWWRIFTAPMLHGNIVHFLMNAAALIYLGKRMEVFARWPHVPLVFLFSACVGGEASARFLDAPSVGASGGLMGWLGFLLVFEWLHSRLVPRAATRRLLAGVALTALIGVVGFRFIDNAAHAGGLLAGIAYAAIVFPKSTAPHRPRSTWTDRLAGSLALLAILCITAFTILRIAQA